MAIGPKIKPDPVVHKLVCGSCVPAWTPAPVQRLDDLRGNCEGCGQRDGNLRRAPMYASVAARGWSTATGKLCGVQL